MVAISFSYSQRITSGGVPVSTSHVKFVCWLKIPKTTRSVLLFSIEILLGGSEIYTISEHFKLQLNIYKAFSLVWRIEFNWLI